MDHNKHELFGFIMWLLCAAYLMLTFPYSKALYATAVSFFLCMVGSVIPDIDCKKSKAFSTLQLITFVFFFTVSFIMFSKINAINFMQITTICLVVSAASVILLRIIMPKHRGKIHSVKAGLIYSAASFILSYFLFNDLSIGLVIAFFALMSFVSHLALDVIIK